MLNVSLVSQDEHDLELELAKTLTIDEFISKAGVEQHIGASVASAYLRAPLGSAWRDPFSSRGLRRGAQGVRSSASEEAAVDIPVLPVREEH